VGSCATRSGRWGESKKEVETRSLKFAGKFILAMMAIGLTYDSVMRYWVLPRQARENLAQRIQPVRLENVELGSALQQLADSTHPALHLSMCPDVASTRVTVRTTSEMPFQDFALLVARTAGAEVDLVRPRHQLGVPFPHLYFARSDCGHRGYVYVYKGRTN